MTTRALIVTADDFGFTREINRGIVEALECGAVTATSMLVGLPGWDDAVRLARAIGAELDIGLHLNLCVGTPIARVPSLCDARTGDFLPARALIARAFTGRVSADETYAECLAQAQQIQHAGLTITHIDGHRHLHLLPGVWEGVVAVAEGLGNVPIRVPREPRSGRRRSVRQALKGSALDALARSAVRRTAPRVAPPRFAGGTLHGDHDYVARLHATIAALGPGTTELMTHPGYASSGLPGGDVYDTPREVELRALTSNDLYRRLIDHEIVLTRFSALVPAG
jgi:predicted glycoside hydrolase/deacetylase ChbG (UPF0249 family)